MKKGLLVLCALWGVCSFFIGRNIPFQVQKELLEPLLSIAGIIFGVLGIWVGILYPGIISKAEDIEIALDEKSVNEEVEELIFPFVISLVLLVIIILLLYLAPVLKVFCFPDSAVFVLRGIAFSIVSIVTLCWIYRVLKLLVFSGRLKRIVSIICAKRQLKEGRSNGFRVDRNADRKE